MTSVHALSPTRPAEAWRLGALLLCLAAAGVARAHDIVIVPEAGQLRVRLGHPQDWQPVDGEKLLELDVMRGDAAARDTHAGLKRRGLDLWLPADAAVRQEPLLAAARYDNGLWVQLPAVGAAPPEWRNSSRWMLPDATDVSISLKFAKAYAGSAADANIYRRSVGHLIELIPQKNPLAVRPGESLPVLLMFDGKPLAGAGVELSDLVTKLPEDRIKRYTTDAAGIAQVPLRPHGVHMLGVDLTRPNDGSLGAAAKSLPAEKVLLIATYTFMR